MINQPPPFQGLNLRIPITIPSKGKVFFFNHGSTVGLRGSYGLGILGIPQEHGSLSIWALVGVAQGIYAMTNGLWGSLLKLLQRQSGNFHMESHTRPFGEDHVLRLAGFHEGFGSLGSEV